MLSFFNWGSKPTSSPSQSEENTSPQPPPPSQPPQQQEQLQPQRPVDRSRNLKLLFGGMTFFAFSVLITRRAFNKRVIASVPSYYTASVYHRPHVNGGADAFHALSLATINVCAFAMMASGGVLYALDINSIEDMRAYVHKGGEGTERDEVVEKEVEEWVAKVLGDKFGKELKREKDKEAEAQEKESER